MTLHNAKGLEFKAVFVIGMEEGIFPHVRSIEEQGVEEERRLAYVGLTRAQERLVLTHATSRSLWGNRAFNLPSRFLDELPSEGVVDRAAAPGLVVGVRSARAPARGRALRCRPGTRSATARSARAWSSRVEPGGVRHGPVCRRRRRAAVDARVRAAGEDRVIEIRPVANAEELRDAVGVIVHYFGRGRPDEAWAERWLENFELERMLAAFDGDAIVGGAGAFSFRLTVPGGATLPCCGTTVVGVLPTHRRRGILRSMMRAHLDDARDRGEPLAALWASEETIYGRYGYGLATLSMALEIAREHGAFRPGFEPVGKVSLVDADAAAALMPPVYDAVQRATPGMVERASSWWRVPAARRSGGLPRRR